MLKLSRIPRRILVGPTAAGKTEVVHAMARRNGWGIISADSMMVYTGMDIGTAKPTREERLHHVYVGLDLVRPDEEFSVHDYLRGVELGMREPASRVGDWVITGGTGLYIRSLACGLDDAPGRDPGLRSEAEYVLDREGLTGLKSWCLARDPHLGAALPEGDRDNPRRWIRALERRASTAHAGAGLGSIPRPKVVGIRWDRNELEKRIFTRVERMYQEGLLDEVERLRARYEAWSVTAAQAIGYAEALAVLDSTMTLADAKQKTVVRTRQYAKRQMTWFRNQCDTRWVDRHPGDSLAEVCRQVETIWSGDE